MLAIPPKLVSTECPEGSYVVCWFFLVLGFEPSTCQASTLPNSGHHQAFMSSCLLSHLIGLSFYFESRSQLMSRLSLKSLCKPGRPQLCLLPSNWDHQAWPQVNRHSETLYSEIHPLHLGNMTTVHDDTHQTKDFKSGKKIPLNKSDSKVNFKHWKVRQNPQNNDTSFSPF